MTDEEIIRRYGKMVYAIAMNYTRNRFDADDVYSEAFLRYFKKERIFSDEEHRKAYIIRIAINCAKDFVMDVSRQEVEIPEQQAAAETDSETVLLVRGALEQLSPDERNLVYLFYYQGMKSAEIAAMLDISDDVVRTRLKRAREKLKSILSQ